MNKKISKKQAAFFRALTSYSALGGALLGSMNQAQATIQYATLSGTPVSNTDVVIGVPAGSLLFREQPGMNSVLAYIGGGLSVSAAVSSYFPDALNAGVAINAGGAWKDKATQFLAYQGGPTGGNFINTSGKFIAFRFNNGGIKYGWIRFNIPSDASSFTLVDWAYEDDGSSLLTGQTGPLPIELLSFDAKSFQNAVDLLWETANEINFEGFSLERAEEGGNFSEIAWLPGKGNSDEPQTYRFRDEAIFENKRYYYRLKSIDIDGSFEYSQVVEVAFSDVSFTVKDPYPNPTSGNDFSVDIQALEAERINIQVFSSTGQMMKEQKVQLTIGSNTVPVSISDMSKGIYFVKIQGRYYSKYKRLVVE